MFGLWISVDDFCRGWLGESEGWTPLVGLEWWGCRSGFVTVDPSVRRLRRLVAGFEVYASAIDGILSE